MKKLSFKETRDGAVQVVTNLCPETGATLEPETFAPFRTFSQSPYSRSRPGVQWMKTMGTFLPYESRLESDWLLAFDYDTDITAVSTQPMEMRFGKSTSPRAHVPDMFLRHRTGTGIVVGVSSTATLQRSESAKMRAERAATFCETLGWRYRTVTDMGPCRRLNLRFLAGYRTPHPELVNLFKPLAAEVSATSTTLRELALTVSTATMVDVLVVRAAVFAAIWDHHLAVNLDEPLTDQSVITVGGAS